MALIEPYGIVHLKHDAAVPPLLRGLYAEVLPQVDDDGDRCHLRVFTFVEGFFTWLSSFAVEALEPDAVARYRYTADKLTIQGPDASVQRLRQAWYNWTVFLDTHGRDTTSSPKPWLDESLGDALARFQLKDEELQTAQELWDAVTIALDVVKAAVDEHVGP